MIEKILCQLRETDREISLLEEAREAAWIQATRITTHPAADRIQAAQELHRFDGLAILDQQITDRINDLARMKADALRIISCLEAPLLREVMTSYYVCSRTKDGRRKTWEMVAEDLHMSSRTVQRYQRAALKDLSARFPVGEWSSSDQKAYNNTHPAQQ